MIKRVLFFCSSFILDLIVRLIGVRIGSYLLEALLKNGRKTSLKFGLLNDHISNHIVAHGSYESDLMERIVGVVRKNGDLNVAIDVGANIGVWTRLLSAHAKHVFSFEPQTDVYYCLKANTLDLFNVEVFNVGLSDGASCTAKIFIPRGNAGGASLNLKECSGDYFEANVQLVMGDNFDFPGKVDFIKIDVEGHELEVLKGLSRKLDADKPCILFEWLGSLEEYNEILNFLKSLGYFSFLDANTLLPIIEKYPKMTLASVYKIG